MSTLNNIKAAMPLVDLSPEQAKDLQLKLRALGFLDGAADGIVGPKTKAAWASFKLSVYQTEPEVIGAGSVKLLLTNIEQKSDQQGFTYRTDINWRDPSVKIGKYFTVRDVTKGDSRRVPTDESIKRNIINLVKELDKVREAWGGPIGVTSWYRPPAVNRAVGGARYSQHLNGSAADVYPIGGDVYKFQKWLDARWRKALGYGAKKGFVHVDLRAPGQRIRWHY